MGLLDDAIREHLDLKRRRGADPTEVERAEREALGPVRRDPFEHAEDEPEAQGTDLESPGAYDQAAELGYEEYEPEPVSEPPAAPEGAAFAGEEPFGEDEPFADEEPFEEDEQFVEEEPLGKAPTFPAPHSAEPGAGHETEEYDVETTFGSEPDSEEWLPATEEPPQHEKSSPAHEKSAPAHDESAPAHDEPPGEDDVLEETPEFLQDAPEHDRLWFEQRPPKDFDFDG